MKNSTVIQSVFQNMHEVVCIQSVWAKIVRTRQKVSSSHLVLVYQNLPFYTPVRQVGLEVSLGLGLVSDFESLGLCSSSGMVSISNCQVLEVKGSGLGLGSLRRPITAPESIVQIKAQCSHPRI